MHDDTPAAAAPSAAWLVALSVFEYGRAAPLSDHQVVEFQTDYIADTSPGMKHQAEDRCGPNVVSQFNLSQQFANFVTFKSFRCEFSSTKLLYLCGRVPLNVIVFDEPTE